MEAANTRGPKFLRKRRLKVEDVNVVDDSMLKKQSAVPLSVT